MKDEIIQNFSCLIKTDIDFKHSLKDDIVASFNHSIDWYLDDTEKFYNELGDDDFKIIANNAAEHFLNILIKDTK